MDGNIALNNIDPYNVFKVPKNFQIDDVKGKYRRMARKLHPDKNPGIDTQQMMTILNLCYQKLLEDYVARMSDKPHDMLKRESQQHWNTFSDPPASTSGSGSDRVVNGSGNFDVARFNQVFQDNRLGDVNDHGYGDWLQRNMSQTAIQKEEERRCMIQKYQPQLLHTMNPNSACELGVTQVQDYSSVVCMDSLGRRAKGMAYSDLRVAHTTTKLLHEGKQTSYREYKNVQELERERARVSSTMSADEQAMHDLERKREQMMEAARVKAQKERDAAAFQHYARMHNRILGYNP